MRVAEQQLIVILILLLLNLKLQQTTFLIPKMLQIFILHIIIIILDTLIIENLLLQLLRISIVNHNFAASFCANNAITINKDATHLAVTIPQAGLSHHISTNAHTTNSITMEFRITLIPYIVVKYLINTYCYLFYIQIYILFVCVLNNVTHKYQTCVNYNVFDSVFDSANYKFEIFGIIISYYILYIILLYNIIIKQNK